MKSEIKYPELYRIKLTGKLIKNASEGIGLPPAVNKLDWVLYNLGSAMEDLSIALERIMEDKCTNIQRSNHAEPAGILSGEKP